MRVNYVGVMSLLMLVLFMIALVLNLMPRGNGFWLEPVTVGTHVEQGQPQSER